MGKIFGFFLLVAGLAIIGFSIYLSVSVFTGKVNPPELFKVEKSVNIQVQGTGIQPSNLQDIQKEIQRMLEGSTQNLLASDPVIKLLNLISFSILAGILIFAGGQVGGLGIKMMRNKE